MYTYEAAFTHAAEVISAMVQARHKAEQYKDRLKPLSVEAAVVLLEEIKRVLRPRMFGSKQDLSVCIFTLSVISEVVDGRKVKGLVRVHSEVEATLRISSTLCKQEEDLTSVSSMYHVLEIKTPSGWKVITAPLEGSLKPVA